MIRRTLFVCALLIAGMLHAAEPDALAISANIQAKHLPFGTILDPMYASAASNQIIGYTRCGDSAIWTGHYLAAESFRYRVTQSADALNNVRAAIAGIKSLVDVTGTNLLARCAVPANSPYAAGIASEEAHNGIFTNKSLGLMWVGNTSRDQYSGVFFGLGVAYDMVDDAALRSSIADLATRMLDYLTGHAWTLIMPDFSISTTFIGRGDQMLSLLQIGRHLNPGHYTSTYNQYIGLWAPEMLAPIAAEITSDTSYFKFNLDYINFYNLNRLESSSTKTTYDAAYAILRLHTADHQNAFFNMIDRALRGPNVARDAATLAYLDAWLLRPKRDVAVDLTSKVPVCGDQACDPVPVALRPSTDFLWQRSPFQLTGAGAGTIESAGIDYILPYWMARYYGVGAAFAVQSAAAGVPQMTADEIASAYGSGFPASPVVTVADATGAARTATIFYSSITQINFLIPAGTAPGTATFTIAGVGVTLTNTGTIQSIAPTLFSTDASGSGIAAVSRDGQYLSLYGTGIRHRSSLANVTVTINGTSVPVLYAGAQRTFTGLDQINVQLPPSLMAGTGEWNIVLIVDGIAANVVTF